MKCRRCNKKKSADNFYKNSRNKSGAEYICVSCKSIETHARKYGISEIFLEYLYTYKHCMCCKEIFANKVQRHIHHTNSGVQGLVCIHCNHILGQEAEEDLQRINDALTYIKSPRENLLGRDNQQERLYRRYASKAQPVVESSETLCCESQMCSQCKRQLMNKSFSADRTRTRKVCIDCRRSNVRLSQSKQATELRNKTTTCACCGCELIGKKCIHHIQDTIFGVVCNRCNQLLGNETEHHKTRLLACKLWIEDSLVWDYDKGRSGWRHPETDRNDQSCDLVAQ